MKQQLRAEKTRRHIVETAAAAFDELGYAAASTTMIVERGGITRGALYFHFPTKEAIAEAVLEAQGEALVLPDHRIALQALIDLTFGYAHRLQTDPVLRGAVRLAVERSTYLSPDASAYQGPERAVLQLLERADEQGEVLPTVDLPQLAQLIISSFTGIQLFSQATTNRADLPGRIQVLWRYLLPSLAVPSVLPHLQTPSVDLTGPGGA